MRRTPGFPSGPSKASIAVGAMCLVAGGGPALAAVFAVTDENHFQAALTAAQSNGEADTIQLAAGVYDTDDNGAGGTFTYLVVAPAEPFGLILDGSGAGNTFLDGNQARQALALVVNGSIEVRDLTVRNVSVTTALQVLGGAALVSSLGGDILVEDCAFEDNAASVTGNNLVGGTLGLGATVGGATVGGVTLRRCTFDRNRATQAGAGDLHGGAVAVIAADAVEIEDCRFSHQVSEETGGGLLLGGVVLTATPLSPTPLTVNLVDLEFSDVRVAQGEPGGTDGSLQAGVLGALGESVTADGIAVSRTVAAQVGGGSVFGGLLVFAATDGDVTVTDLAITGSSLAESEGGIVIAALVLLSAQMDGDSVSLDRALLADNSAAEDGDGDLFGGLVLALADLSHVADLDARRQAISESGAGILVGGGISNVAPISPDPVSAEFLDLAVLDSTVEEAGDGSLEGGFIVAGADAVSGARWTVMGSSAAETDDGQVLAGVAALGSPSARLETARLVGNSVSERGDGGLFAGVLLLGTNDAAGEALLVDSAIGNNTIAEHDDGEALGGAIGGLVGLVRLVHDSIWANTLSGDGAGAVLGGGVQMPILPIPSSSTLDIYNSVVWGNAAATGADVSAATDTLNLFDTDVAALDVDAGTTFNQGGNLNVNPLFAGFASGDFHLTSLSPVIDQGSAAAPDLPASDFDGEPRNAPPAPDMGADEASALAANQPPINALPGPQQTDLDTPITFSSGGGNSISTSDPDAGASPVRVTLFANHGALTLAGTAGLSFLVGDGTADTAMSFTGTLAAINAALDGLLFVPEPGFSGAAGLEITTNDLGNTGAGGAQSDTDSLSVVIAGQSVLEVPTLDSWGALCLVAGLVLAAARRLRSKFHSSRPARWS